MQMQTSKLIRNALIIIVGGMIIGSICQKFAINLGATNRLSQALSVRIVDDVNQLSLIMGNDSDDTINQHEISHSVMESLKAHSKLLRRLEETNIFRWPVFQIVVFSSLFYALGLFTAGVRNSRLDNNKRDE